METTILWGYIYGDNRKEKGNYYNIGLYWGFLGIMEKKMEATIVK